jgi:transcription elongation factor GreA
MNTIETVYLSKKGMKELRKEIAGLERRLSHETAELREQDRADSREERFERIEKLARIESLEAEIQEKKMQLEHAKLLPRKRDALKVALGSVVDLIDSKGHMVRYTLVNSIEANPSDGRISINSPLGKSLLGRSQKEEVEWHSGLRTNNLKLVRIN